VSAPSVSWNPIWDLRELLAYPFMVQALAAGTIVAVLAGAVGWYMVLRRQTFAGDRKSVV
jgi:zinc/manganese transport system permease protein